MLNPHHISQLRIALSVDPTISRSENLTLGRTAIRLNDRVEHQAASFTPPSASRMRPPKHIFGEPADSSCLSGIGDFDLHIPPKIAYTVPDAKIIGFDAIISQDGALYAPSPVLKENATHLISRNKTNHQGFLVDTSQEPMIAHHVQRRNPIRFNHNAFFFHNLEPGNFGSFIFRQLPQLISAAELMGDITAYIVPERTPWVMAAFEKLNFKPLPTFSVREVCGDTFDSITIFNEFDAEGFFSSSVADHFIKMSGSETSYNSHHSEGIYVSRILSYISRPDYRPLTNEREIEEFFRSKGFSIIYPETLSLDQQINIFNRARRIVGPSGSGMLNTVFAQPATRVVDIESFTTSVRQHAKIYSSTSKDYSFLFGRIEPLNDTPLSLRPWSAPINLIEQAYEWIMD